MTKEQNQTEKKKLSLQELMKQQLAAKKQGQNKNNKSNYSTATKGLKSQLTKKANNQRKRTGV
ncbi:hypothetical protein [Bacillus massiliigorillae]|uniref:hypothetical protein n=1 Tax=Bacillus massiliigorillae TaxID=1243664 RepID=UPI0003A25321|nr:hypothetical protein [Bacillus massiliigorillae]